jgi:hypothetical protein
VGTNDATAYFGPGKDGEKGNGLHDMAYEFVGFALMMYPVKIVSLLVVEVNRPP